MWGVCACHHFGGEISSRNLALGAAISEWGTHTAIHTFLQSHWTQGSRLQSRHEGALTSRCQFQVNDNISRMSWTDYHSQMGVLGWNAWDDATFNATTLEFSHPKSYLEIPGIKPEQQVYDHLTTDPSLSSTKIFSPLYSYLSPGDDGDDDAYHLNCTFKHRKHWGDNIITCAFLTTIL